ncbi:MAG: glycosyltransferase family 4 protein, partial [Proteobacteria bacterium]|nr:glycosyltransferase family 4 protein [Desulfobulbaceae bacterium]MBU4152022.1 glycosyltransferase family 4 protein [Pseudomonadota bacterium]
LVAPLISFLKNGRYNSRKEYLLYCVNIVVNIIALNIADGIIIVHNQLKEEISKYTLRKVKVQVAPQFIEREQDTLPRARLGSSKTINLLTVTNLAFPEKYHGLLFFLNALSRFARDGSEEVKINFDILGDGFYLSKLNDDIKKYCTDRFTVKAHGFVKDVRLFYESADIFLYCSTFDGLPNVLLEAMYFGLPIMVNSYPNFKDILKNGENALFFDIENYDQFVSDLNQLINDQNIYESMSSNNINKSREDYSCLAVAKKLQKIVSLYTSIQ